MRQTRAVTGVQAVIMCSLMTCLVFGQATGEVPEMDLLRRQAEATAGRGEWSEAASLFQSAITTGQGPAWAHIGLADVYRANGVWDKAAEHYEAASAIHPDDAGIRALARLCRQALVEAQASFVRAETFRAISEFPLSWQRSDFGASRDLRFQSDKQAPTSLRIPVQLAFPRNKFTLDSLPPAAIRQLEEVAGLLGSSATAPGRIEVEGHTCSCGSEQANLEVGRKRAEAVRDFLITRGAAPSDRVVAISFGASRPVDSAGASSLPSSVCDRDQVHARNRRVVIVVHGRVDRLKSLTQAKPRLDVSFLFRRAGTHTYGLLADGEQLRSGDEVMIRLRADSKLFAYVFHRGSSGKWDILFPESPLSSGRRFSKLLEPGQEISLPSAEAGFILTGSPGTEETYVYSRQEPDLALEELIQRILDGKETNLLPPELPETRIAAPAPQTIESRERSRGERKGVAGAGPQPPEPPQSRQTEYAGEEKVEMRDLTRPENLGALRLPPNPTAYRKFRHLN